jgi:pyruvate dehydrogenase E1 component beta subunit
MSNKTKLINGMTAIQEALREEMVRDDKVFILGESVEGGGFFVLYELFKEFGLDRVMDTPISENAILGCTIGAAMAGYRPVAEIMFQDFLPTCMDMLVNQMSKLRYTSGGQVKLPLVVRAPGGAGLSYASQHSQSLESFFIHVPGLKVAAPSTPKDMKGLLKSAIRDDNPVLFLENKLLYFESGEVPEDEYTIPFGKAKILREGSDVTVVAILSMVSKALNATETLANEEVSVEVIDPRTLNPFDWDTIINSVKKTNRLVTIEEGTLTGGIGAEIAAVISDKAFYHLDAPIKRIAASDCPLPYSPILEDAVIPNEQKIIEAIKETLK